MAARKSSTPNARSGNGFYIVGKRAGGIGPKASETFRSSTSGAFVTRVMSNDAFKSASGKANTAITEALKHPPEVNAKTKK